MGAAPKLYTFGPELALCEPARRIVDPTPAEVVAITRRPVARQNRGRVSSARIASPLTIVTSVPILGWWRSDLGITQSGTVSQWVDQKNGITLAQGTAGQRPTFSASDANFNGRPSITFDGSDDEIFGTVATGVGVYYWWIFRQISWISNGVLFSNDTGAAGVVYQWGLSVSPNLAMTSQAAHDSNVNGGAPIGQTKRGACYFGNTTADFLQLGATLVSGGDAGNGVATTLYIGGYGGAGLNGNYALAEVVLTGGLPTSAERTRLDAYGAVLYGATVLT